MSQANSQDKVMKIVGESVEKLIYETRWLLLPFEIGLIIALLVYVIQFVKDLVDLITHYFILGIETEQLMVSLLGLADSFMVANLLVMIIKGSHQIFIRKLRMHDTIRPQWLDHIDSGILKIKVALSIASITLVQLLKDFVNIEHTEWDVIVHRMIIHAMCLVSALSMAIIWRMTHVSEHKESHDTHDEHQPHDASKAAHDGDDASKVFLIKPVPGAAIEQVAIDPASVESTHIAAAH